MANNNHEIAANVLEAVGGKENVLGVQHCMTRLRFKLKDDSIPDDKKVKDLDGVISVVRSAGQYQVVIGQNVGKVYDEIIALGGFKAEAALDEKPDTVSPEKEKLTVKKALSNAMNYLSGSFVPLIPAFIAAAMFKTITVLFGPTMLNVLAAESDLYVMADFMYDACFYFLPILLAYTASKKIGANPVLGMMVGASLLVPKFMNLVGVQDTFMIWGIFPAPVANYAQTVLPILISIFFLYYVEKAVYKVIPDILSTTFAPFLTLCIMLPINFCIAAPMGARIGSFLGTALFWFGEHTGALGMAVIAAIYQLLVMTGMHHVIGNLAISVMLEQGVEYCIRPAGSIASWAVFGMALGAFLRMKDKKEKGLALGYFVSCLIGGITEPTLYGIGIKYKRPFIGMLAGGFAGGLYAGITHIGCYAFASPGVLSIMAFMNGGTANTINGAISFVIAMLVSAAVTFVLGGFDENEESLPLKAKK